VVISLLWWGYSDSDMAGDIDSKRSTSDYLINFAAGAVTWQSKR